MKLFSTLLLLLLANSLLAQTHTGTSRFSYQLSLDVQGHSLPFSKWSTYRRNPGFSASVVYDWNRRQSFQQVLQAGFFSNRYSGNHWHVSTAAQYNPLGNRRAAVSLKLGVGYMRTTGANKGFRQGDDGSWKEAVNRKGLVFAPLGVQASIKAVERPHLTLRPFISYQLPLLFGYNGAMPVLPSSLISIGLHIKNNKP